MAATGVCSAMLNLEALTKDNYKYWSFRVKTYLLAKDLWDLVEDANEPPTIEKKGKVKFKAWRKKNARALQAITILCGKDAESSVVYIETARDAWNTLAEKFKPPEILEEPEPESDTTSIEGDADEVELNDEDTDSIESGADETYDHIIHEPFFDDVKNNRGEKVKEFIKQHPGAVRLIEDGMDRTALQTAIILQSVEAVKALILYIKKKDLEIMINDRDTYLSLAIKMDYYYYVSEDKTYRTVKCIAEKNKKLLIRRITPRDERIPLLFALSVDTLNKTHEYLYSATPIQDLKPKDAAELVSTYLRKKKLDFALDLLERFPELAFTRDHSGEFPSYQLVATRATLLTITSELGLWKRLVYSCIIIPKLQPIHKGTGEVSIDCPEEGSEQGDWKHFICKVTSLFGRLVANILHLFGIDDIYEMKLLDERTKEIMKFMCKVSNESNLGLSKGENEINLRERQHRKCFVKVLFQAVERGHAPFIRKLIDENKRPRDKYHMMVLGQCLRMITNAHGKTLFQVAAKHRQDEIFALIINFFLKKEERKEIIGIRDDKFGNNLLHVYGKLSPVTEIAHIQGAALQMQHELLWFKKVESMASPQDLDCINSDGLTPREVFTISHRDLVKEGELSMKETATSSSALVAALIITIMFAAAVTVPGGIDGSTGIPIYLHNKAFKTFIVADIISLCSSTTSVMVFLGILTSRFAEEDFLTSLPTKLIVGFFTLFLSIGAMMVAFSSAIFIMLPKSPSIVIPCIVLAGVPIASFLWMQFPFLLEIIYSTYGWSPLETFREIYEEIDYKIRIIYHKLKGFF